MYVFLCLETKKFYRALNVVGTDFSLMKPYFRNRTRRELKLKFKKEERLNPNLVNKALAEPLDFDITELEKEIGKQICHFCFCFDNPLGNINYSRANTEHFYPVSFLKSFFCLCYFFQIIELEDEEEKRLEEEAKEKAAEKLSEKVAKNGDNKVKRPVSKKKAPKRSKQYSYYRIRRS